MRQNRTKVGLKRGGGWEGAGGALRQNRTKVGLKPAPSAHDEREAGGQNRTKVGLKHDEVGEAAADVRRQNRTKVGLKQFFTVCCVCSSSTAKSNQGGIETGSRSPQVRLPNPAKSNQGGIETLRCSGKHPPRRQRQNRTKVGLKPRR